MGKTRKTRLKDTTSFNTSSPSSLRPLPDLLRPGLELLFVGTNPGIASSLHGHYYSKNGNHFWPCLRKSGLVPETFGPDNDAECWRYGIGFTDVVKRPSRGQKDLTKEEIDAGAAELREKIVRYRPMIVVFNGKEIFAKFARLKLKDVSYGEQAEFRIEGEGDGGGGRCESRFFMMSNTSPLNAHYPTVQSRMWFYEGIREMVGRLRVSPYFHPAPSPQ